MKAICSGITLFVAIVTGFLFLSFSDIDEVQSFWSEPELIYMYPDETIGAAREFQADVHEGTTHIVGGYRLLREDRYLEDSKIFYLQQEVGSEPDVQLFPTDDYPSEQPALLLDRSDYVHFLWGDRRMDPDFEEWKLERPQVLGISTHVIYSKFDGLHITPPEPIYEGHLRELVGGVGDILLPARWVEDGQGELHVVFIADSTYTTTFEGEEVVGFHPKITYMNRSTAGEWKLPQFLQTGALFDITIESSGGLVVAYLGSDPGQHSINDVLVITSDDGGVTWTDPELVYLSGQQPGRLLRIESGKNEKVHMIWGRQTRGLPVPNELWHSYSEDGGGTWSEPERFFQLEQTSESGEVFIFSFDLALDHTGKLHCVAVIRSLKQESTDLTYRVWNPLTNSWEPADLPELSEGSQSKVNLVLDDSADNLYLFWEQVDEDAIYYSVKKINKAVLPPPISSSGPLKLYANHPNPFSSSTQITFTLEEPAEVEIKVYDMSGRQIMQKNLGDRPVGTYAEEVNLNTFSSGTYIYEIALNGTWRQQSTMMYIK